LGEPFRIVVPLADPHVGTALYRAGSPSLAHVAADREPILPCVSSKGSRLGAGSVESGIGGRSAVGARAVAEGAARVESEDSPCTAASSASGSATKAAVAVPGRREGAATSHEPAFARASWPLLFEDVLRAGFGGARIAGVVTGSCVIQPTEFLFLQGYPPRGIPGLWTLNSVHAHGLVASAVELLQSRRIE
jgi:hypothetical protein